MELEGEAVQVGNLGNTQPPSVRFSTTISEEITLEVPIHTQPAPELLVAPTTKLQELCNYSCSGRLMSREQN